MAALIALAVTLPVTVRAAYVYHASGQQAYAYYWSYDDSTCITNWAYVQFQEVETQSPPQPRVTATIGDLEVQQWDCNGNYFVNASGYATLPKGGAQVGPQSAMMDASLELFDYVSNSTVTADVHLTWTPTDERATQQTYHFCSHRPGGMYLYRTSGKSRVAQVSGTVSIGGVNFTLTPTPTPEGGFSSSMEGDVSISKTP
jgi:hypothetical protein